jgi:hypothetical protein
VDEAGWTLLLVVGGFFAVIGIAAVVLVVVVALRYRYALPGALAVLGAVIYGVSPIDVLPEALLGPAGVVDDVGLLVAAIAFFVSQMRRGRKGGDPDDRGGGGDITIRQLPDQ